MKICMKSPACERPKGHAGLCGDSIISEDIKTLDADDMEEQYGERCPCFELTCFSCQAYLIWDTERVLAGFKTRFDDPL